MADRFLGFFGLEAKSKKGKYENSYAIDVPEEFQGFIQDIDNCYKVRAENAIAKAEKISLTELAQGEEEQRKVYAQRDTEDKAQLEQPSINLEVVLNDTITIYGGERPVNYIKEERQVTPLEVDGNNSDTCSTDIWFTPENQNWLAEGLCGCETPQDVEDIRSFAPVAALKSAARLLDQNVRAKVKELTKIANQNQNFGFGMN